MFKRIKTKTVNLAAFGAVGGIFVAAFLLHLNRNSHESWRLLLDFAIALTFFACIFNFWRLIKLAEAPISTIYAAAQGYVELYGKASCDKPLKTPYQGIPCVWYRAWVFANSDDIEGDDSIDLTNNQLLDYSESQTNFTLNDGTATCEVNPQGAEVIYFMARTWRKHNHRYAEEYLPANKNLYVIGQLDTRKDLLDKAKLNQFLSNKLSDWKARPQQLLHRYDQNRDSKIDLQEWQLARQEAHKQVLAEHALQANTGSGFTLQAPVGNHLFLISAKSPQQLRDSHKNWLVIHFSLFTLLCALYIKLA